MVSKYFFGNKAVTLSEVWIGSLIWVSFVAASIGLSTGAAAKTDAIPKACSEYTQFIASGKTEATIEQMTQDGCIKYEILIMSANGWPSFVWNFERYISSDGYPVRVSEALRAWKNAKGGIAVSLLDAASSNAHQVFTKAQDRERGVSYVYLLTKLRNRILADYVSDTEFLFGLLKIKKPHALSTLIISGDLVEAHLICLIQLDSWTGQFSELISSKAFTECIDKGEER